MTKMILVNVTTITSSHFSNPSSCHPKRLRLQVPMLYSCNAPCNYLQDAMQPIRNFVATQHIDGKQSVQGGILGDRKKENFTFSAICFALSTLFIHSFQKKFILLHIMSRLRYFTIILLSIIALSACNSNEKLLKSNDYEAKYAAAIKYYEQGSYMRANQLFENLQLHYRNREMAENVTWYYAQSLMKQKDFYAASYQLVNFVRRYPYSEHAEEAAFQAAYCQYRESPEYSLDQELTHSAIKSLESFSEHYPNSVYMPQVNQYLDELRNKLMRKDYEIAIGYYNIEQYHAAYIALNEFLNKYPESPQREEAMFYILRSGFEFGMGSREDKVKERLSLVVNDFDRFVTTFKDSKHISQAQKIYTTTKATLAEIEKKEKAAAN